MFYLLILTQNYNHVVRKLVTYYVLNLTREISEGIVREASTFFALLLLLDYQFRKWLIMVT